MAITNLEQLEYAYKSNHVRFFFDKQTSQNIGGGQWSNLFNSNATPVSNGVTPGTTAEVLNRSSTGALPYRDPVSPQKAYFGEMEFSNNAQNYQGMELHDWLVRVGGFNATLTTAQTITGFDLQTLASSSNLSQRYGAANYAEVKWWFTASLQLGATGVNFTVNVTYHDGTSGNIVFAPGGTYRGSRMFPLNSFIPAADTGKHIRALNTVTLSATTGGAGNFGFIATRFIGTVEAPVQNKQFKHSWPKAGLTEIYPNSCLAFVAFGAGVNSAWNRGQGKILYG